MYMRIRESKKGLQGKGRYTLACIRGYKKVGGKCRRDELGGRAVSTFLCAKSSPKKRQN